MNERTEQLGRSLREDGKHLESVMTVVREFNRFFHSKKGRLCILLVLFSFIFVVTNLHLSLSSLVRKNKEEPLSLDYNVFLQNDVGSAVVVQVSEEYQTQICKRPKLSLLNDAIKHAFHKMDPLLCTGYKLFYLEDGILRMNYTVLNEKINSTVGKNSTSVENTNVISKCEYLAIERVNDDYPIYTESIVKITEPFDIIIKHDFIRVQCRLNGTDEPQLEESFQPVENELSPGNKSVVQDLSEKIKEVKQKIQEYEEKREEPVGKRKLLHSLSNLQDRVRKHMPLKKETKFNFNVKRKSSSKDDRENFRKLSFQYSKRKIHNMLLDSQINSPYHLRKLANYEHDDDQNMEGDGKDADYKHLVDHDQYHYDGDFPRDHPPYYYDNFMNTGPDYFADFDQFLVQIYPKESVFRRISEILNTNMVTKKGMNVLMIGLDSMSNLAYQRKLPLTYRYLKNILEGVILHGYNIVGDATTAALVPMLTGKNETELPEVRKNQFESSSVDSYPLIWNLYKERGYATLYAEDEPSIGAFNLRLNGFEKQPTDHYMRPFWQTLWSSNLREASPRYCTGATPNHIFMLDYLKDFYVKYNNVSKFSFAFLSELTHWDNNPGEYLDEDLLNFLKLFKSSGYLDDTLLILMSDHGARYSKVRYTIQGKMEERLPFMSFVFPKHFRKQYPKLMKNLKRNSNRLTTPFDIYETLRDVLDIVRTRIKPSPNQRGISLFQEIPLNRTCRSAHIDMHWCTCLSRRDLNTENVLVKKCANEVIRQINQWTEPVRKYCTKLQIKRIVLAYLVIPNEKVLKYQKSQDEDNRIANFSQEIKLDVAHYQITIETYPNDGMYEATILVNFKDGSLKVYPDISRLTKYGNQPACIQKRYPDLRKYCYCKSLHKEKGG